MLRKLLKWLLIIVGVLIIIIVVAVYVLSTKSENRRTAVYKVEPMLVDIPTDSASLANGKRWADALCAGCHGYEFEGKDLINDEDLGRIVSPNITSGRGGMTAGYQDKDWVRAIRNGLKPTGMPTMVMPSQDFQNMSDEHLGSIIAYLKTIPPKDKEWPLEPELTTLGKVLVQLGALGTVYSAEVIDHNAPGKSAPAEAVTVEFGNYVQSVYGCVVCHGADMSGGLSPEPGAPPGPNLTPGGNLANWSSDDFLNTIRTGVTPEGKKMDPDFMPWKTMKILNDTELRAMFEYFSSLPALESAVE